MLTRTFVPRQLLRHLYGTAPFAEFCEHWGIGFVQTWGEGMKRGDELRWRSALRQLDEATQMRVELELAQVNELADAASISLLMEASLDDDLLPVSIPGDAARSLWFLLHHPAAFHEVLLRQEIAEVGAWRIALAPPDHSAKEILSRHVSLAESLRDFLCKREGTGQFCTVDAFLLGSSACFVAYLSDRLHLLDVFTEDGQYTTRAQRPAVPLIFVYEPDTGRIRLRTRLRSQEKLLEVVRRFGQAVLGVSLPDDCLRPAYRLDVLKHSFDLPPDATDVELARVKCLHLAYPEHSGRRRVKLETLSGDDRNAILDLLREHGGIQRTADDLSVLYAELEVRLRVEGRSKPYVIRLWPDRTSLSRTALGRRFHSCLRRWGIADAD